MNDLAYGLIVLSYVFSMGAFMFQDKLHKKEVNHIHETYAVERQELLDRIMANNITEFKTSRQESDVRRSQTGNYLRDRMEKSALRYIDGE